jgi:cytochrome c-type biogenesis protein CcmE
MGARRVLLIAVLAAAVLIGFVAVQNLASSAVYYLTPTEARDRHIAPRTPIRLGGQVERGTLVYEPQTRALRFVLTDGTTQARVIGAGAPPALLREGAGAVVEGAFDEDGVFRATQVIAKHDEQYAPPSPGATPRHTPP